VAPIVAVEVDRERDIILLVSTTDQEIGRTLFVTGEFEAEVLSRACAVVTDLGRPLTDKRFVDIGANVGSASILAICRHQAADAIAFEPDQYTYQLLTANAALNNADILAIPTALGSTSGQVWLERHPTNGGAHRVTADEPREDGVKVAMTTYDEAARVHEIDADAVGLVWIDVEGHELLVLLGASTLLARRVPLVLEFWPELIPDGADALTELLCTAGYQNFYDLRSNTWLYPQRIRTLPALHKEILSGGRVLTDILVV